jgi:predicted phosphodiesterase
MSTLFPFGKPICFSVGEENSHKTLVETYKGVLMVNPGSPTLLMGLQQLSTVGILKINQGKAKAYIVQLR